MAPRNRFVDGYDAHDFGADYINKIENYHNSGLTHYTAYSTTGGQISWDVDPNDDSYQDNSIHLSDRNLRGDNVWW
jgi:hypothetical protein